MSDLDIVLLALAVFYTIGELSYQRYMLDARVDDLESDLRRLEQRFREESRA